jgi:hypothetical protein
VAPEERISLDDSREGQIEKLTALVEDHRMRGKPAEPLWKPRLVNEPAPDRTMLGMLLTPVIHVRVASLLDWQEVWA